MSRYLLLDVGAGTLDMLYYDDVSDIHYKAVVRSPVKTLAEKIVAVSGDLIVTGHEMGGGPVSRMLKQRAESNRVVMSVSAAATLHHDLERVSAAGIEVVSDEQARALSGDESLHPVVLGDVEPDRIRKMVRAFGVGFAFEVVGVCAQDHGEAPKGVSHLDFWHRCFSRVLEKDPAPQALLYDSGDVPESFNRLRSIAAEAAQLDCDRIFVMDSGMAAILGASMDPACRSAPSLVLDIATSHTVGAAISDGRLAGFFEYHTQDIRLPRLEQLLRDLADGRLSHETILAEGGHGAWIREAIGFDRVETILATGPQRRMVADSRLPMVYGAPWGDNMMTGTVGLLTAIRLREGKPVSALF